MNSFALKDKLVSVLQKIQLISGKTCPPINDSTKPIGDLPDFDSKIWPVAMGMLGLEIGVTIPYDQNIFRDKAAGQCVALSVGQITARLDQIIQKQSAVQ